MTLNILNRIIEIGYLIDPRDEDNIITVELPLGIRNHHAKYRDGFDSFENIN